MKKYIKIKKIISLDENDYNIQFEYKTDFNEIVTCNIKNYTIHDMSNIINIVSEFIPSYHCK